MFKKNFVGTIKLGSTAPNAP